MAESPWKRQLRGGLRGPEGERQGDNRGSVTRADCRDEGGRGR